MNMSKEFKDVNIRQFKLSNSEDLVAYVTGSNDHYILVERPAVVYCTNDGRFKLQPWFQLSSHDNYKINRLQIISDIEVDDSVKEAYIQFSTYIDDDSFDDVSELDTIDHTNMIKH